MHMQVAGREMWGELVNRQAVQLWELHDDGTWHPFSFPIGRGEAGWDQGRQGVDVLEWKRQALSGRRRCDEHGEWLINGICYHQSPSGTAAWHRPHVLDTTT
jgi:hypothetical protein